MLHICLILNIKKTYMVFYFFYINCYNESEMFTLDIARIASSLLANSTLASPDGRLLLLKRMLISTGSNGSKNYYNFYYLINSVIIFIYK